MLHKYIHTKLTVFVCQTTFTRIITMIEIPYIGTLRIARERASSIPANQPQLQHKQEFPNPITIGGIGTLRVANSIFATRSKATSQLDSAGNDHQKERTRIAEPQPSQVAADHLHGLLENLPNAPIQEDFFRNQNLYPGLAAGVDDWAFQGVDTASFENLMQGSNFQFEDVGDMSNTGLPWHVDLGGL